MATKKKKKAVTKLTQAELLNPSLIASSKGNPLPNSITDDFKIKVTRNDVVAIIIDDLLLENRTEIRENDTQQDKLEKQFVASIEAVAKKSAEPLVKILLSVPGATLKPRHELDSPNIFSANESSLKHVKLTVYSTKRIENGYNRTSFEDNGLTCGVITTYIDLVSKQLLDTITEYKLLCERNSELDKLSAQILENKTTIKNALLRTALVSNHAGNNVLEKLDNFKEIVRNCIFPKEK